MRSELRVRVAVAIVSALLVALAPGTPGGHSEARAAAPVTVDASSAIQEIRFEFTGGSTFTPRELRRQMTLSEVQPTTGLRRALSFLPFVPDVGRARLNPVELQQNVARLRRFYELAGFPEARIGYRVTPADAADRFDITFEIEEGAPRIVQGVRFLGADSAAFVPPERVAGAFEDRRRRAERLRGSRLSEAVVTRLEGRMRGFWNDRGFAFAEVRVEARVDSLARTGELLVHTRPGPETRIGEIRVEGTEGLRDDVVRRELPFRAGDLYAARKLVEGQREIQGLPAIRLALVDAPLPEEADSTIDVRVRVTEAEPRLLEGELGYVSDAGLQGELRATHHNFLGSSRGLTASVVARPGTLARVDDPEELYRGSLTLQQPYVFDRRLSWLVGPFLEFQDDLGGRSREFGGTSTLVFALSPLRSLALQYQLSRRRIFELRAGDLTAGRLDFLTLLALNAPGVLDSLGRQVDLSQLSLTGTVGTLDNVAAPRQGFVFRPALALTLPGGLNSYEYGRVDLSLTGFLPLRRGVGVVTRVSAGRLYPYGRSLPVNDEVGYLKYLGFRDAAFTAGGVNDNRGWGNRLLGPKYPDVRFRSDVSPDTGADTLTAYAVGFVPLGGLQRLSLSTELRLPLPGFGPEWGSFLFLDGGRVWTDDPTFAPPTLGIDQERFYYAAGVGIDFKTAVGAVRLSAGYKLNPSLLDLADSREVLNRIEAETSLIGIPQGQHRRWQLHLAIGSSF